LISKKIKGVEIIKNLIISLMSIVLTLSFSFVAKANYTSEEFQKTYFEIGYKEVHEALKECNEHFMENIGLPIQLPPVPFSHSFGRCNKLGGEVNHSFEIEYLHMGQPKNHYMIRAHPVKYGLPIRKEHIDQALKLKDRSKAVYATKIVRGFNLLVFERNGFQYVLSVDKRISDKVTSKILMEIANSVTK
jgi:hypothetical protein